MPLETGDIASVTQLPSRRNSQQCRKPELIAAQLLPLTMSTLVEAQVQNDAQQCTTKHNERGSGLLSSPTRELDSGVFILVFFRTSALSWSAL